MYGAGVTRERTVLMEHLRTERQHVLAGVDGLGEEDLTSVVAPSGWSIAQLLNHLVFDVEIFWGCAIIGGDDEAIACIRDGWKAALTSGARSIEQYAYWTDRVDSVLADTDLDEPPRWWPSKAVFPFPPFADARQCAFRILLETATHAGHLDMAREAIDGRQHLVVN